MLLDFSLLYKQEDIIEQPIVDAKKYSLMTSKKDKL